MMRKLFNFRPIVAAGLSVVTGVVCSAAFYRYSPFIAFLPAVSGAIVALVVFAIKRSVRVLAYSSVFILLFSLAALLSSFDAAKYVGAPSPSGEITFCGRVNEVVFYDAESDTSGVVLTDLSSSGFSFRGGNVYARLKGEVDVGDEYGLKCKLSLADVPTVDTFYYPRGIVYEAKDIAFVERTRGGGFFYVLRIGIKTILKENLSEDGYAFTSSLLLGEAGGMSRDVTENFRAAGVSHVFAVSGLHIGFLAALLSFLFDKLRIKRLKNALLVLLFTALYAGICGFSVSSLRAVITCFVYGFARSFGFKRDDLNAVFISLTIVLLAFPSSLFSYGFLLSFSAVTGIALFRCTFVRCLPFLNERFSNVFSVALSAFVATAPIIAVVSGRVSLVTVLANLLFLPVVSAIFYIAVISVAIVAVFRFLGSAFFLTEVLTRFVLGVTESVEFSRFLTDASFGAVGLTVYYTAALLASDKINIPKNLKIAVAATAATALITFI